MKVLLRETLENIGTRGDIVDVKEGFARNYLLPRKLAVPATETNFKQLEMERAQIAKRVAKEHAEMEAARAKLETASVTIAVAASPEGHLYGSVGPKEVAEALAKDGFTVTEQNVKLEEHIKEVGVYVLPVSLGSDLSANIRVWVVNEATG